ncbi:MAG TPA: nucleoid occlusion protein [Patescibacteria group bacterium]|nr:nucleoid occlusion protein [Patescibacteria group bacterium]
MDLSENLVVMNIPVDRIAPNPYQPRKEFSKSALEELSASIKQYGVLQPINVRSIGDNFYELISGERRLRASKLAGLSDIPAVINEVVEHDSAVIALIENLQREDLNFIEEAEGYSNLINDHGMTQEELAQKVGKKQSTVANKLRLLKLPQAVKKAILENGLTERHARALLKLPDEAMQNKALKIILKRQLNVKKTEEMIEKMLDEAAIGKEPKVERKMKGKISYNIYVNTIKNTYKDIIKTGYKIDYDQVDKGEYIEITLKVPKNA